MDRVLYLKTLLCVEQVIVFSGVFNLRLCVHESRFRRKHIFLKENNLTHVKHMKLNMFIKYV